MTCFTENLFSLQIFDTQTHTELYKKTLIIFVDELLGKGKTLNNTTLYTLVCPKLSEMALCCKTIDYEDLHGSDTSKLEIIGKVLMEKFHLLLSDNVNIITPLCTNNLLCAASTQEELK